jgi:hypothetical protein
MQRMKATLNGDPSRSIIYLMPMQNKTMNGFIYSKYFNKTFQFYNEYQMLSAMDDLFDSVAFPQALFEKRSFLSRKIKKIIIKADDGMEEIAENALQNEKTTFVVHVQYRQNATWQGSITWVEQNRTQNFRSSLEMLKLMEEASNQGEVEVVDWNYHD